MSVPSERSTSPRNRQSRETPAQPKNSSASISPARGSRVVTVTQLARGTFSEPGPHAAVPRSGAPRLNRAPPCPSLSRMHGRAARVGELLLVERRQQRHQRAKAAGDWRTRRRARARRAGLADQEAAAAVARELERLSVAGPRVDAVER